MTVKELIEELKKHPKNAKVYYVGYTEDLDEVRSVEYHICDEDFHINSVEIS